MPPMALRTRKTLMGCRQHVSLLLLAKEAKGRPHAFPKSSSGSGLEEAPLNYPVLLSERSPSARTREWTLSCP